MQTNYSASTRRSPAQWAKIVEQSETTALSLRAFCDEVGVPLQSLYCWRSKLKPAARGKLGGFTELKPGPAPTPAAPQPSEGIIELRLANGRIVRVTGGRVDAQALRTVIQVAEAGAPC